MTRARLTTLKPRVASLTPSKGGWTPDTQRGSRHERGYGWAWEKRRASVIERDKSLCQPCLKADRVTVFRDVDHVVSKAEARALGWTDDQIEAESNLQCICGPCHDAKTARESQGPTGGTP